MRFLPAMLAMAGLPIYIHAPKFYVDTYGVGLERWERRFSRCG
jgi:hypothetical protein